MSGNKKLSGVRRNRILRCFCLDITASKTAPIAGVNRNTVNHHFATFRRLIYQHQRERMREFVGIVEFDESYFGPARQRGQTGRLKPGRGSQKQAVFGIYERGGRVYTELIPDCSARSLLPIIRGRVDPSSVIYTDAWNGYQGLVHMGYDRHVRINKNKDGFTKGKAHINGIEAFWSFTKRRLAKFNGVRRNLALHLKECEWRYGKDPTQLEAELQKLIRNNPIS